MSFAKPSFLLHLVVELVINDGQAFNIATFHSGGRGY